MATDETHSSAETNAQAEAPKAPCTFFKKPPKSRNVRKRDEEEENGDENEGSAVVRKAKAAKKGGFSTGGKSEKPPVEDAPVKSVFFFDSSKEVQTSSDNFATAALETETEFDKDARALREKVLKAAQKRRDGTTTSKADEKKQEMYKGMNAYTDHRAGFRRENSIAAEKAGGAHGPLRASQHIRMSARFDYQPDICKDYKETGYCGYGDACKFLHDRGDYKSGWQLEREWEEAEKTKRHRMLNGSGEEEEDEKDEDDEELPFACFICRESFVDPVVTPCKHYFCEHCALKHHMKSKTCFVCNKPTNGALQHSS